MECENFWVASSIPNQRLIFRAILGMSIQDPVEDLDLARQQVPVWKQLMDGVVGIAAELLG